MDCQAAYITVPGVEPDSTQTLAVCVSRVSFKLTDHAVGKDCSLSSSFLSTVGNPRRVEGAQTTLI